MADLMPRFRKKKAVAITALRIALEALSHDFDDARARAEILAVAHQLGGMLAHFGEAENGVLAQAIDAQSAIVASGGNGWSADTLICNTQLLVDRLVASG